MAKAFWKRQVIAEADRFVLLDDTVYFPRESVRREHLKESRTTTVCGWKGTARYYTVVVDGDENRDAAWCYPDPKADAASIKGYIAFWRGVRVER